MFMQIQRHKPQHLHKEQIMIKYYPATGAGRKKTAIILRCPDSRLLEAHKGFIRTELNIPPQGYFSLKRAGGAIALARHGKLPEDFRSILDEIRMFLELHPEITHIILINHEDCKKYTRTIDRKQFTGHPEREDLRQAAKFLEREFHGIQVGGYFARFNNKQQKEVYFETVYETDKKTSLRKQ
jgi:hypothetical protein